MRYFMRLAYCGANYHGWQVQPHDCSVQQTLEQALAMVLRAPTPVTGAGRTDTGVNAAMMIAHFDTAAPIADCRKLAHSLNGILPRDIAVRRPRTLRRHQPHLQVFCPHMQVAIPARPQLALPPRPRL